MQNVDSEDEELTPEEATDELSVLAYRGFDGYTYEYVENLLKRGGDPNVIDDWSKRTCMHALCFEFRNCKETSPFESKTPGNERLKFGLALLKLFLWQDNINVNILDDKGKGIIHLMTTEMQSYRFLELFITTMHMRLVLRLRHNLYNNNIDDDEGGATTSYDEPVATGEIILMFPKTMAEVVNLRPGVDEYGIQRVGTALFQICKNNDRNRYDKGIISDETVARVNILANLGKADPNIGDSYAGDDIGSGGDSSTPLSEIMRNHPIKRTPKWQYHIVGILLNAGIKNINRIRLGGYTYLHYAIRHRCPGGVVRLLLEYGADPFILTDQNNDKVPAEIKKNAFQLAEDCKEKWLAQVMRDWHATQLAVNRGLKVKLEKNQDLASKIIRTMRALPLQFQDDDEKEPVNPSVFGVKTL
jgi:ankyrin repeat protein